MSSTLAELIAFTECVSDLIIVINIQSEINIKMSTPMKLYEDDYGAIMISKPANFTMNSRCTEVQYYAKKIIDFVEVNSDETDT